MCTFTFLLFLVGYILQQQTLHALQETLKPLHPLNPNAPLQVPLAASLQSSPKFGGSLNSASHASFQSYISPDQPSPNTAEWTKLAHVQLVKDHHSVCNAIMHFASLHALRSPARRILLFPQVWAAELAPKKGANYDPYMASTRRLLKLAARRYRVELRPIQPLVEGGDEEKSASYSLASIYALQDLDRAMVVEVPGLLFKADVLDQVLAYSAPSSLALLEKDGEMGLQGGEVVLVAPAKDAWAALRASELANGTLDDVDFLRHILPEPLALPPTPKAEGDAEGEEQTLMLRSISTLHDADSTFDATKYLSTAAYVRFSDPKMPRGPEWDVPYDKRVKARPRNKDADWVWTKLYGEFAQKRMEVCGLDLEPWREW